MSLGSSTPCVEMVDDLRLQDIQVTGLSIPILVRMEKRRKTNKEFVGCTVSQNTLRYLLYYSQSVTGDSLVNLTSVLLQHNSNPVFLYNGDIPRRIKVGGEIEDQIYSRLSGIFSQVSAPNIVKQLSWLYLFDQQLAYVVPGWTQVPLVQYLLYTLAPSQEHPSHPFCEPATKWIFCLRGNLTVHLLSPTPENVAAFRNFLKGETETLFSLFETKAREVRVCRSQVLFIPSGWIYIARREKDTLEYGGEFFHSFAIETQFGVWHVYKDIYLDGSDGIPPFLTCHWLLLQAYLSSFQDMMLTTKEEGFSLESNRDFLPHFSPFEGRGMLFLIEIIRSGRVAELGHCIPSVVNCPVSLLQKMQTILLHETVFSTFSSSTPNGILFVGTPNLINVYMTKDRDNILKIAPLLDNSPSTLQPGALPDESENESVSLSVQNADEGLPDTLPLPSASSSLSNYLSVLSESPSIQALQSNESVSSQFSEAPTSTKEEADATPTLPIRSVLLTCLSPSVIDNCGICQACEYNSVRPDYRKKRRCVLHRISGETLLLVNVIHTRPIFLKLIKLLHVYPPLASNSFLSNLMDKAANLNIDQPSYNSPSTLEDIQEVLREVQVAQDTPLNHSTPSEL